MCSYLLSFCPLTRPAITLIWEPLVPRVMIAWELHIDFLFTILGPLLQHVHEPGLVKAVLDGLLKLWLIKGPRELFTTEVLHGVGPGHGVVHPADDLPVHSLSPALLIALFQTPL